MTQRATDKFLRRIARLDAATERLLDEMSLADDSLLVRAPVEGAWTPLETLHHLVLAERGSVDYLQYKLDNDAVMPRMGVRNWVGGKLLAVALASPLKFEAPPQTDGRVAVEPTPRALQPLAEESRAVRTDLRSMLERMPAEWAVRAVYRHPTAGRMSLGDMIRMFGVHQRRHAKQIRRALAQNARYNRRQEAR